MTNINTLEKAVSLKNRLVQIDLVLKDIKKIDGGIELMRTGSGSRYFNLHGETLRHALLTEHNALTNQLNSLGYET